MLTFKRTDAQHTDFQKLVKLLDSDLAIRDGEIHHFYAQFNKLDFIKNAIVAYADGVAVSCGAFKPSDEKTLEIKRMFVLESHRNQGIAAQLLNALENWGQGMGYQKFVLETGLNQPEALRLYHKCQYQIIPNYGQYAGVATSVCFEKVIG